MSDTYSSLLRFWQEFQKSRAAFAGLVVLVFILLVALFAHLIMPQNPYDLMQVELMDARRPPGSITSGGYVHLLGTDEQGRDMLSAIAFGLKLSLEIGFASTGIALVLGSLMGTLAAYTGGKTEAFFMRLVDLQLAFPAMLLALVLSAALGQGKIQLIIALIASQYAYFARTAHGIASAEKNKEYVVALRSIPLSGPRVMLRHILPNIMPSLIVVASAQIANAIALESTLSFLGLGLPSTEPSLGMLIANGFQYMLSGRYWISIYPGLALILLIGSMNLVGDQLREQINPRLRR